MASDGNRMTGVRAPQHFGDVMLPPGSGIPAGLVIPAAELSERFSRSSGPGGQSVNTADSRVELSFDVASSALFTDLQRERLLAALEPRLVAGVLTIASSEHRSQLRNRSAARDRLAQLLGRALAPPAPARRPRRASMASRQRRLDLKKHRGGIKSSRRRPGSE